MKKRIVVIGATGNTGAYLTEDLVNHLSADEYEVFAAGRRETNFFNRYNIGYTSVDMSDASTLEQLPQEGRPCGDSSCRFTASIYERL